MRFGRVRREEAEGGILAHTLRAGDLVLKKGRRLSASDLKDLDQAGVESVTVALMEAGDIDEDVAATRIADLVRGENIKADQPFTGRVNLFAERAGVLVVDREAVDSLNRVDEAITLATLPAFAAVAAGEMVATVKIIPYAVEESRVSAIADRLAGGPALRVSPYAAKRVAVVSTILPGLKPSVIDKTLKILGERVSACGGRIVSDARVPHDMAHLAPAIAKAAMSDSDIVIVFGASAVADRKDVVPAAITYIAGRIEHLGMPVDPGNLLLLAEVSGKPMIGAPGCARSPKLNGFDWVLQRLMADLPVCRSDIQALGVGGLLTEIPSRPQPRAGGASSDEEDM
jgi:molybdenum cofactor cytidylyltransferase